MGRAVQIEPIACQCCAATAISRQTTMLGDEVCGGVGEALSSLSPCPPSPSPPLPGCTTHVVCDRVS